MLSWSVVLYEFSRSILLGYGWFPIIDHYLRLFWATSDAIEGVISSLQRKEKLMFSMLIVCKPTLCRSNWKALTISCPPSLVHPFLRFIPTSSQPIFLNRERFGFHYRGTFERKLIVLWTFVFSKLGSIIVNEQTIVAGKVQPIRTREVGEGGTYGNSCVTKQLIKLGERYSRRKSTGGSEK